MDIFSSKPPDFRLSEIRNIVHEKFGLEAEAKILDSDRDQNIYLYDKKQNHRFVLKIFNPIESLDIINLQTNVLDHFQANKPRILTFYSLYIQQLCPKRSRRTRQIR